MKLKFAELAQKARVSVENTANFIIGPGIRSDKYDLELCDDENIILACPYPAFSIELMGNGTVTRLHAEGMKSLNIKCMYCEEKGPGEYVFIGLTEQEGNNHAQLFKVTHNDTEDKETYATLVMAVEDVLSVMDKTAKGIVRGIKKIPVTTGSRTTKVKPPLVVYVQPKSEVRGPKLNDGTAVVWDHSWPVRAHWRQLHDSEKFGKDRWGNYTQKGYTWVMNHVKGEGPLRKLPYMVGRRAA